MFAFVKRLCILLFWFCKVPFIVIIFSRRSLQNSHNTAFTVIHKAAGCLLRLDVSCSDLLLRLASVLHITLLLKNTHTIKLRPLAARTSKYNLASLIFCASCSAGNIAMNSINTAVTCSSRRLVEFLLTENNYSTDKRTETSTPLMAS